MSEKTEKNFEKLATRLFGKMRRDQLPGFRQVIKALEIAKGEKFKISAEQIEKLQAQQKKSKIKGDSSTKQWCALCDYMADECEKCDASDWGCGGPGDVCVTCDEGDHCDNCDNCEILDL